MVTQLFARRYLFSRNSRSVINIIAGVSIAAVAVPVMAMIILLSVFNGFEGIIRGLQSSFDPDIAIKPVRGAVFTVDELPKSLVMGIEGVAAVSYVVEQSALVGYRSDRVVASIRGVDEDYERVLPVSETITSGDFGMMSADGGVVLGRGLAYGLGARMMLADERVTLYAVRRNSFSTLLPVDGFSTVSLPVSAIFAVDAETDGSCAIVPFGTACELFDYPDSATAMFVRAEDSAGVESLKRRIAATVGDGFAVVTRDEANASLYRILRYEKWGIFIIALLVLIIASLSIVGVLVMLILEKRRDIETLRAVGADTPLLRSIFRAEGVLICSIGGFGGLLLGVVLCLVQQWFGIITIPSSTLVVDAYPVELHAADVAATAVVFAFVAWAISSVTVNSMLRREAAYKPENQ